MGKVWNVSHPMALSKQYDNLDARVHSKNELKETPSLAIILTEPQIKQTFPKQKTYS